MRPLIGLDEIRGVVALLPTPSTEQASDPDAPFAIDLAETERATRALVSEGVGAVMTNGSLGEMATLSHEEWKAFNQVVVESAAEAVPVFVGVTTLGTRNTIALAREVRAFGGKGILVGRPFWCALDSEAIVDFYRSIAGVVPDVGICVYDNPDAFKGPIPTAVYEQICHLPQMLAAKYTRLGPKFRQDMAAVSSRMHLLPIEVDWVAATEMTAQKLPACWSSTASCGPKPVIALAAALDRNDLASAKEITKRIAYTYETFLAMHNPREFPKYNIPVEKIRCNEAGFMKAGPARHPYQYVPPDYAEGSMEFCAPLEKSLPAACPGGGAPMPRVSKISHAGFTTPDVERQLAYYTEVLGLTLVERTKKKAYLACTLDHHCVVLSKGGNGVCNEIGFQIGANEDLKAFAGSLTEQGIAWRLRTDPEPGVSEMLSLSDPKDTHVTIFKQRDPFTQAFGNKGVVPIKLGHVTFFTQDVRRAVDWYTHALGFRETDWVGDFFAFLRCGPDHHTINLIQGKTSKMHHIAFELRDWNHIQSACDLLSQKGHPLVWGPGRHSAGHSLFAYHRDADHQLVELFAELDRIQDEELGYFEPRPWHEDRPQYPKVWDPGYPSNLWGIGHPPDFLEG